MHERMPRSRSWASPGGVAPMEPILNSEIIHDKLKGDITLGKGEQTGHYLGREGEMQDREESPVKGEQTGHYLDRAGTGEEPTPKGKRQDEGDLTFANGEQTGRYLGMEEEMQLQDGQEEHG